MLMLVLVVGLAAVVQAEEVLHGVAVAPGGLDAWVVTIESTAMYHSGDFGNSWQSQPIPTTRDFFDVFFLDSQNGWTCGRAGDIWHTTNGGDSWYRQNLAVAHSVLRRGARLVVGRRGDHALHRRWR